MKKKLLVAVLSTAMMLSLAACGETEKTGETSDTTGDAQTTEKADTDASSDSAETGTTEGDASSTDVADSDKAYVVGNGKLVVGITDFEPMDYRDENGDWTGFDAELAEMFGASIGVDVEFIEIDWDTKVLELDSKAIDCVWNGMTLTPEVESAMECSNAYCDNAQIVVIEADSAADYTTVESMSDLVFAVEAGSAGEEQVVAAGLDYVAVTAQADALMEVAAGTSDAAVIDALMAAAMVGPGTSYENLTYTIGLNSEKYGVGFRKGSDLAAELNSFLKSAYDDGSLYDLAAKYHIEASLIAQ